MTCVANFFFLRVVFFNYFSQQALFFSRCTVLCRRCRFVFRRRLLEQYYYYFSQQALSFCFFVLALFSARACRRRRCHLGYLCRCCRLGRHQCASFGEVHEAVNTVVKHCGGFWVERAEASGAKLTLTICSFSFPSANHTATFEPLSSWTTPS